MSKELPSCSIIVPTFNRPVDTVKLIGSLAGQIHSGVQIIVVDDGSSEDNWNLLFHQVRSLEEPNIGLLRSEHVGVSKARNIGIDQAKNGLLMFTDSDCIAAVNWVEVMANDIERADAVQGNYWTQEVFSELDRQHMLWRKVVSQAMRKDFPESFGINTRNFGIWKSTLIAVCGSNPFTTISHRPGGEDVLLGRSLLAGGVRAVIDEDAVVFHTGDPHSIKGLMKQKFHHGTGNAVAGVLSPDTFGYGNFARGVVLPMKYGVSPLLCIPLWFAHTTGAAYGSILKNKL